MKLVLIFLAATTMMSETCKNKSTAKEGNDPTAIPACIQQRIDSLKKEARWNPPAEINEYRYNGKRVFLMSSPCCDFYNTLVDSACNYLCAPSGGFTGRGDGKCPDFDKQATFVKQVWKDER